MNKYYSSLGIHKNENIDEQLKVAIKEHFIIENVDHTYSITILGAALFAKDMTAYSFLTSHTIRLIRYATNDRTSTLPYDEWVQGYAISFEEVFNKIMSYIALPDSFPSGIRTSHYAYPHIAIREALGNTIIHQDLTAIGQGPLIEIFPNRIEFSNPGRLLIEPLRIINTPSVAINERLASFLRRMGMGDAVVSGFDKIIVSLENEHMPAPLIEQKEFGVRLMIPNKHSYNELTTEEKIRTIYFHTVIVYLRNEETSNSSIREALGVSQNESYQISRLLKATLEKGLIKKSDESSSNKNSSYIPYWA